MLTIDEIAQEINSILRQRAKVLDAHGLATEREAMGPNPGAWWRGGPKIEISVGDPNAPTRDARYAVKRDTAESYLRVLRESPANYGHVAEHARAYGKRVL